MMVSRHEMMVSCHKMTISCHEMTIHVSACMTREARRGFIGKKQAEFCWFGKMAIILRLIKK